MKNLATRMAIFIFAISGNVFAGASEMQSGSTSKNSYCIGGGYYTYEDSTYNYQITCSDSLPSGKTYVEGRIFFLLTETRRQAIKDTVRSEVIADGYWSLGDFVTEGAEAGTYEIFIKGNNASPVPKQICLVIDDAIIKCSKGTQLLVYMDGTHNSANAVLTAIGFSLEAAITSTASDTLAWKVYSK